MVNEVTLDQIKERALRKAFEEGFSPREISFLPTLQIKLNKIRENREIARCYLVIIFNDLHSRSYALLEDVFVEEEFRGKGIGTELVKNAIEIAKACGCYKIIATSRDERREVHHFYLKIGFKEWGKEFRIDFD